MGNGKHENPTVMKSGIYDILKFCALIAFPALGTLYFTVAQIWGLPKAEEVVGTIVAVDAFLGVLLGVSKVQYDKSEAGVEGAVFVDDTVNPPVATGLHLQLEPEQIQPGKRVTVKIKANEGGVE